MGGETHGARLSHVLMFAIAARPRAKIRGVPRSMRRGVWLAGWMRGWVGWLLAGCGDGWGWFAGWLLGWGVGGLVGWLRVVVLKVGERLAGGTLARVYNASTGLYGAL